MRNKYKAIRGRLSNGQWITMERFTVDVKTIRVIMDVAVGIYIAYWAFQGFFELLNYVGVR